MKKLSLFGAAVAALALVGAGCSASTSTQGAAQAPAAPVAAPEPFPVGTKVLAKWHGGTKWYSGTVSAAGNGSYSVLYDDGGKEQGLSVNLLGRAPGAGVALNVGDKVSAKWKDGGYYGGTITAVSGTTATVQWDDGSAPLDVALSSIVLIGK